MTEEPDLSVSADERPKSIILDVTPALTRRILAERGRPAQQRNGTVIPLRPRSEDGGRA